MEPKEKPTEDEVNRRFRNLRAKDREAIIRAEEDERQAKRFREELRREAEEHAERYAEASKWTLSTGREMGLPPSELSLSFDHGQMRYGSDGPIWFPDLTQAERLEIAETVCAKWREWAESPGKPG